MKPILQKEIPYDPLAQNQLPGVRPVDPDVWLLQDDAFAEQMRRRAEVLQQHRSDVLAMDQGAVAAAQELLELVLTQFYPNATERALRQDGVSVAIDRQNPLETLCQLVQEDLCILQKRSEEHVLTGAILCFPASWKLSEKLMRPLTVIHSPIAPYDENIARRVQRLFDGIQPGRPLWRFNALWYSDAELYQPRSADRPREIRDRGMANFLRSERQTLLRLPETRAVVFAIHTYVMSIDQFPEMENPA